MVPLAHAQPGLPGSGERGATESSSSTTDAVHDTAVEPDRAGTLPSAAAPAISPPEPHPQDEPALGLIPIDVLNVARDVVDRPLVERIDAISAALRGRPYRLDPLGEGRDPDPDPLVRYDVFDCLTFVEEVLALALASEPAHAGPIRLSLRYGDQPASYANRRHFMELQWIPGNVQAGWLRDTTAEYGPTQPMRREVTAKTWAQWRGRSTFQLDDAELPTGEMALDVLPLDQAIARADAIRPGSLLLTVRADRSYKPIWVSHVGIIVPGEQATVRHATPMGSGGVRDHSLRWYLTHLKTYTVWPAVGVVILEPVAYGPRRSRAPRDGGSRSVDDHEIHRERD